MFGQALVAELEGVEGDKPEQVERRRNMIFNTWLNADKKDPVKEGLVRFKDPAALRKRA